MSTFFKNLWRCAFRPKSVDTSSTDLKQELSLVDLVPIGLGVSIGLGGCILMGTAITEYTGASVIISILLASLNSILTGSVCSELGCRMPRTGGIYTHVYSLLGELPAILVAFPLFFDLIILSSLAAKGICDYIGTINNDTFVALFKSSFPLVKNSSIFGEYFDLLSPTFVIIGCILVIISTKNICQVSTICIGFALLVFSAVSFLTLVRGRLENWTMPEFFNGGFDGLMTGTAIFGHLTVAWCSTSLVAGEVFQYQKMAPTLNVALPVIFLLIFFPLGAGVTLSTKRIRETAFMLQLLQGDSLFAVRYFLTVTITICLICCIMMCLLVASRLLNCLSRDNLALAIFGRVCVGRGTPWTALLFCGFLSAVMTSMFSIKFLSKVPGVGSITAGIAGSMAVVSKRYHPDVFNPLDVYPEKERIIPETQISMKSRCKTVFDSEEDDDDDDESRVMSQVSWKKVS